MRISDCSSDVCASDLQMRSVARSSLRGKVGGALLLPSLRGVRSRLDYRAFGAVPLLGVEGGVFIGHGRSDGAGVAGALRAAYQAGQGGMLTALKGALESSGSRGDRKSTRLNSSH